MRFKLRTLLLIVAALSIVATIAYYANNANQTTRNAYAVWWVADMAVEHMDANDGRWPANWDDLRDDYQTCVNRSGQPWQFDDLKRRVTIDWNANPDVLLKQQTDGTPNFRVIWLTNGTDSHWTDAEPNQIILNYLNKHPKSRDNKRMN